MWARKTTTSVVALVLVGLASACGDVDADRSGGTKEPRVLVLANSDRVVNGIPAVEQFAKKVEQVSGGRLRIKIESGWGGEDYDEAGLIRDVAAGKAALGWAGTRAFDLVGVKAFQPLHLPLLVGSYGAQAAVVQDPLVRELLDQLDEVGLEGLGLAVDQVRIPAAAARPILTAADFEGLRVRTMASQVQADVLEGLEAEPATTAQVSDVEEFDAAETMLWTYVVNSQHGPLPFLTRNLGLWPRGVVLFGGADSLADLGDGEREWLRQGATEAVEWSVQHAADRDATQLQRLCKAGARVATATPQQLAAFRAALEPQYERLRNDAEVGAITQRVEALVADVEPDPLVELPAGCAYQPGDEANVPPPVQALTGPGDPGELPEGVYRMALTRQQIVDAGLPDEDAYNNAGVTTWTLRGGSWRGEHQPTYSDSPAADQTHCEGWYTVDGEAVSFTTNTTYQSGECAPPTWSARWSPAEGGIAWRGVSIPDFAFVFGGPGWQRIG
jgi:TRAP-type transport system periplasmic protein